MTTRLTEIDALRGLAICGMILFHAAFDAMILGMFEFEPYGWPLIIVVRAVQFLFLGLAGVSVALSGRGFTGQLRRGALIFLCGMLVSFATWILFPDDFVKFGVLHFVGVVVPILVLFKGRKAVALVAALGSFFLGEYFLGLSVGTGWLFPFGLLAPGFSSLDYFPIFPWLAVPLVGLVLGEWIWGARRPTRLAVGTRLCSAVLGRIPLLAAMGRHSLAIYLLHQPVLYFSLWALKMIFS